MIRVFPLLSPYVNCGPYGPRGSGFHYGVDLCAPKGTPAVAVDDGSVTFGTDPMGGNVAIVHATDGGAYYYAHLDRFEGQARQVRAGETIAYVDHTGNAALTMDHLHFEAWPSGQFQRPAPDPTADLLGVLGSAQTPGLTTPTLAGKALLLAWTRAHPNDAPPQTGITLALAQAIGEGSFTSYFRGTNNWGAMHATEGFARRHLNDKGYGMVAFLDTMPTLGHYVARMLVVPSVAIGAAMFLSRVESDVGDLSSITDETSYATALYVAGYYTGTNDPATPLAQRKAAWASGLLTSADAANVSAYANLIKRSEAQAAAGITGAVNEQGDPDAVTTGPPFASLGERLTPSPGYAPHTIEHARALLKGNASNPPPGGISLADALNAGGDGVWLFGQPQPQPRPSPSPAAAGGISGGQVAAFALLALVGVAVGAGAAVAGARG